MPYNDVMVMLRLATYQPFDSGNLVEEFWNKAEMAPDTPAGFECDSHTPVNELKVAGTRPVALKLRLYAQKTPAVFSPSPSGEPAFQSRPQSPGEVHPGSPLPPLMEKEKDVMAASAHKVLIEKTDPPSTSYC